MSMSPSAPAPPPQHQDAQPEFLECGYLVVGAGATGLAFADTLLHHDYGSTFSPCPSSPPRVLIVDKHEKAGGHWNDSYGFVRLHQPSAMYGVESEPLEPTRDHQHRATREEILAYYERVVEKLTRNLGLRFIGGVKYDFKTNTIFLADGKQISVRVQRKVVDARWLQPDLPVSVPPKFAFDPKLVHLVTPNDLEVLPTESSAAGEGLLRDREDREERTEKENVKFEDDKKNSKFVIVGAGKTGMDAVVYLQTVKEVAPEDILWIVPTETWITAREDICSCMEFLATCVKIATNKHATSLSTTCTTGTAAVGADFLQRGFVELEKQGKFYRLLNDKKNHGEDSRDEDEQVKGSLLEVDTRLPAKFKDATLCKRELEILRRVPHVFRGGRLHEISWNPDSKKHQLHFADGSVRALPWPHENLSPKNVTFVHCSAGAFNYTRVQQESGTFYEGGEVGSTVRRGGHDQEQVAHVASPPVFSGNRIVIQDVYGTPGFCFVGSVIGKIETLSLSDEEKNRMCRVPQVKLNNRKEPTPSDDGGGIGALGKEHGLVQRLCNLRDWYETAGLGPWLHGDEPTRAHRLFNLNHLAEAEAKRLLNETHSWIAEQGLVE